MMLIILAGPGKGVKRDTNPGIEPKMDTNPGKDRPKKGYESGLGGYESQDRSNMDTNPEPDTKTPKDTCFEKLRKKKKKKKKYFFFIFMKIKVSLVSGCQEYVPYTPFLKKIMKEYRGDPFCRIFIHFLKNVKSVRSVRVIQKLISHSYSFYQEMIFYSYLFLLQV